MNLNVIAHHLLMLSGIRIGLTEAQERKELAKEEEV